MIKEWYNSGLATIHQLLNEEEKRGLQPMERVIETNDDLVIVNNRIDRIIAPIFVEGSREYYYWNEDKRDIEKYIPKEALTAFSGTFFRQQSGNLHKEIKDINELDAESRRKIEKLEKKIKSRLRKERKLKTGEKIEIITSETETFSEFFSRSLQNWKVNNRKICSMCNTKGAGSIKGWLFPFSIEKNKFPNLYPNAKEESINICNNCAKILFAAYRNILFNSQRDALNFLFFYSDNYVKLAKFLRQVYPKTLEKGHYFNFRVEKDACYYPYEFLALALNEIIKKLEEEHGEEYITPTELNIGVAVFGVNTKGPKKIFNFVEKIDDLHIVFELFKNIRNTAPRDKTTGKTIDTFGIFFRSLRSDNYNEREWFIRRNSFVKDLLLYRRINWRVLEDALSHNIRSRDRGIAFSNLILEKIIEVYNMSEKEVYEKVSHMGWIFGKKLMDIEKKKDKVKRYIYDLRRARKTEVFLDVLNGLQVRSEYTIDERPFRENEKDFYKLKVYFQIGMANAIFGSSSDKKPIEEAGGEK